jgi:hypothetical protein
MPLDFEQSDFLLGLVQYPADLDQALHGLRGWGDGFKLIRGPPQTKTVIAELFRYCNALFLFFMVQSQAVGFFPHRVFEAQEVDHVFWNRQVQLESLWDSAHRPADPGEGLTNFIAPVGPVCIRGGLKLSYP